jgi:hypothetical protein
MLRAGVVFFEDGMMNDGSRHAAIVTQTRYFACDADRIQRSVNPHASGFALRLVLEFERGEAMAGYREPPPRRRMEVPMPPRKGSRQKGAPYRNYGQDRVGTNRALIDAGIVVLTTLLTTVLLLAISGQIRDTTAADLMAMPLPLLLTTPVTPLPTATPSLAPTHPAAAASTENQSPAPAATPDDTEIQAAIDRKLGDDASLSQLGITATVNEGKVVLVGTAPSDEMKAKVEKLVRGVKGVKQIDNQIVVITQ